MRYPDGGGLDAGERAGREQMRLATMAAYCAAVGLPFIPRALTWEPGERASHIKRS
jgi:hypothetical protein